ncbi:DUF4272 domain-containing protein [Corynebacterium heidelbergense]|uniref:DUF4272 domain-containing protein n=1 Tax=Corynebacterium heidelbergense TaxID=2055947 RepID=A0A364V487_9CORY|nr:DUF4272 domain-containing protein [Corynebacterium heidelbergense]RAV31426.1 hypothetical protein DLJ54_08425 [Corynebacterium heidelbergense]
MSIYVNAYSTVRQVLPYVPVHPADGGARAGLPDSAQGLAYGPALHERSLAHDEYVDGQFLGPFVTDSDDARALQEHIDGFFGYAVARGHQRAGSYTAAVDSVARHIRNIRRQYVFERPDNYSPSDLREFSQWAEQANAIFLIQNDNEVRNAEGRDLLGTPPTSAPTHPAARARRDRIRGHLWDEGIQIAQSLPPVLSEFEIVLRRPEEIYAQAQSVQGEDAAVETLLWAVGLFEGDVTSLYPAAEQRAAGAAGAGETPPSQQLRLRNIVEFCDAFEYVFSMRWFAVDQQLQQDRRHPEILDPRVQDVLLQRHRAFAWMSNHRASWSEVDLST